MEMFENQLFNRNYCPTLLKNHFLKGVQPQFTGEMGNEISISSFLALFHT